MLLAMLSVLLLIAAHPAQAQTETVLYSFGSQSGDAVYPRYAGVVLDKQGNLYGTTLSGGAYGWGTVFKLTPTVTETVLYSFGSQSGDARTPHYAGSLIFHNQGNLYGTTYQGGAYNLGAVFKVLRLAWRQCSTVSRVNRETVASHWAAWFLISKAISTALRPVVARTMQGPCSS